MATTVYLDIDQGSDYTVDITVENDDETPLILTGYTIYSSMSKSYGSCVVHDFVATVADDINGKIRLTLAGEDSTTIRPGRYLFDILGIDGHGKKTRLADGIVVINPAITRPGFSGCSGSGYSGLSCF